jgi:hypothetical protein
MNWQIVLLSWVLIHAPIALCIGRAFKSSFAGGFKHPLSGTVVTAASSPSPRAVTTAPLHPNMKSTLAPETGVDSATEPHLTDPADAVAGQFRRYA